MIRLSRVSQPLLEVYMSTKKRLSEPSQNVSAGNSGRRKTNSVARIVCLAPKCFLLLLMSCFLLLVLSLFENSAVKNQRSIFSEESSLRRLVNHLGQLNQANYEDSIKALSFDTIKSLCPTEREGEEKSGFSRRVLVTGSAGFIGFHVALGLKKQEDFVIGFDNFNNYYPVVLKKQRAVLLRNERVGTIKGDLNDTMLLTSIMNDCGITHVVHLAAQAGVRYAKKHPMEYIESNIHGTVSLFEAARLAKSPPEIIYASSSSVYGSNEKVPFSEDDVVDHPTSLYGSTKRSVELMAVVYHRLFDLSMTGLRFFTVYGPWGRPDMACFQFAKAIVKQEPITVFRSASDEELGRDFTYIDDIVIGIIGAMNSSTASLAGIATNRIFNLGNTHPVTVSEFVQKLENALEVKAEVKYKRLENSGDVLFTHANVSKAHQAFNFTPMTSLDEGLMKFSRWFKNYSQDMTDEMWNYQGS
eukprot:g8285.t1